MVAANERLWDRGTRQGRVRPQFDSSQARSHGRYRNKPDDQEVAKTGTYLQPDLLVRGTVRRGRSRSIIRDQRSISIAASGVPAKARLAGEKFDDMAQG